MFLDANIFIYAYLGSGERKTHSCRKLLDKINIGEQRATTSALVAEEVLHIFLSMRGKSFAFRVLKNIIENPNLEVLPLDEKALTLSSEFIEAGLGSADALHAATMKANGETTICSFDRGFDSAPGLRRKEP